VAQCTTEESSARWMSAGKASAPWRPARSLCTMTSTHRFRTGPPPPPAPRPRRVRRQLKCDDAHRGIAAARAQLPDQLRVGAQAEQGGGVGIEFAHAGFLLRAIHDHGGDGKSPTAAAWMTRSKCSAPSSRVSAASSSAKERKVSSRQSRGRRRGAGPQQDDVMTAPGKVRRQTGARLARAQICQDPHAVDGLGGAAAGHEHPQPIGRPFIAVSIARTMSSGSASRPSPVSPQAVRPSPTGRNCTPHSRSRRTASTVADAATSPGSLPARSGTAFSDRARETAPPADRRPGRPPAG